MNIVTGAFGYIGKYIAGCLLERGEAVKTITTHPDKPNPFGSAVEALPYNFDKPEELTASLRGASTLYNTYWVRFEHRGSSPAGGSTFQQAVDNTATLFDCARQAGVRKIVHISVTQASVDSPLPYYRGKGLQERALIDSGVSFSVLRPTLVFGKEDILVNNMAWLMRTFPVFPIFGSGEYRVQPVFVEDLARIAVASTKEAGSNTQDVIGPETYTFEEMIRLMAAVIKPGVKLIHVRPSLGIALGRLIGLFVRDVILTEDELQGLMDELLTSSQPPNGTTRFSEWLRWNRHSVGATYISELARHFE